MRLLLLTFVLCGSLAAQQPASLSQFLGLTPAQVASVTQLNGTLNFYVQGKIARENVVQAEIAAENAKTAPSALPLGQRYIEIDSIEHEIAAANANLHAMIAALLTPAQTALVQQIVAGSNLRDLNGDASCGYLEPAILPPTFLLRSGDFSGLIDPLTGVPTGATAFFPTVTVTSFCSATYPVSVRTYLALADSQVSAIIALRSAYTTLQTRKTNRTNDVEVEIRDETAKPLPDPLALGVRYAELIEIQQELKQADIDGRAAARNLLMPSQQAKLKDLMDATALSNYQYSAASCRFLLLSGYERTRCQLN